MKENFLQLILITNKGQFSTDHYLEFVALCVKAKNLVREHKTIIAVSGAIDFITDGFHLSQVVHGSHLMSLVTGMGCAVTAIIAAFKAVLDDPLEAGILALHYFTLCGELAALNYKYPGTFRSDFIDQLYRADFTGMKKL